MARVELIPTRSAINAGRARPAGVAGNTDGYIVNTTRKSLGATVLPEQLLITLTVATAPTNITVKAGDYPPALAAGHGDLVYAAGIGSHTLGPFESGRFIQNDGSLLIDVQTAANVSAVSATVLVRGQN